MTRSSGSAETTFIPFIMQGMGATPVWSDPMVQYSFYEDGGVEKTQKTTKKAKRADLSVLHCFRRIFNEIPKYINVSG